MMSVEMPPPPMTVFVHMICSFSCRGYVFTFHGDGWGGARCSASDRSDRRHFMFTNICPVSLMMMSSQKPFYLCAILLQ